MATGWNRTRATLVGGERSHQSAIPAPHEFTSRATVREVSWSRTQHSEPGQSLKPALSNRDATHYPTRLPNKREIKHKQKHTRDTYQRERHWFATWWIINYFAEVSGNWKEQIQEMLNRSQTLYARKGSNENFARVREYVLPTTKSCPLIRPADTSSCATPSAVSEWGKDQDKAEWHEQCTKKKKERKTGI